MPKAGVRADEFAARVVGTLLATYAAKQISPQTVSINWQKTPEGKPYFENCPVQFSITHADGVVGVAVAEDHPVGLDIERVRPLREGFVARYFSDTEQAEIRSASNPDEALIRLWTAKEAVGKHHGAGLGGDIAKIDTQAAVSAFFENSGTRYALSLSPKAALPPLEWVDFSKLVP